MLVVLELSNSPHHVRIGLGDFSSYGYHIQTHNSAINLSTHHLSPHIILK
uniref:Uncharacterized protein n=1 Tax=Lepeophtheirus salmonis TaxID=72036 RepID=A0A0K2TW26_LEPSM